MAQKHTPIPWYITKDSNGNIAVNDHKDFASDLPIAVVNGTFETQDANARLIAAAPELLAFIEIITTWAGQIYAITLLPSGVRKAAANLHNQGIDLIKKAKG